MADNGLKTINTLLDSYLAKVERLGMSKHDLDSNLASLEKVIAAVDLLQSKSAALSALVSRTAAMDRQLELYKEMRQEIIRGGSGLPDLIHSEARLADLTPGVDSGTRVSSADREALNEGASISAKLPDSVRESLGSSLPAVRQLVHPDESRVFADGAGALDRLGGKLITYMLGFSSTSSPSIPKSSVDDLVVYASQEKEADAMSEALSTITSVSKQIRSVLDSRSSSKSKDVTVNVKQSKKEDSGSNMFGLVPLLKELWTGVKFAAAAAATVGATYALWKMYGPQITEAWEAVKSWFGREDFKMLNDKLNSLLQKEGIDLKELDPGAYNASMKQAEMFTASTGGFVRAPHDLNGDYDSRADTFANKFVSGFKRLSNGDIFGSSYDLGPNAPGFKETNEYSISRNQHLIKEAVAKGVPFVEVYDENFEAKDGKLFPDKRWVLTQQVINANMSPEQKAAASARAMRYLDDKTIANTMRAVLKMWHGGKRVEVGKLLGIPTTARHVGSLTGLGGIGGIGGATTTTSTRLVDTDDQLSAAGRRHPELMYWYLTNRSKTPLRSVNADTVDDIISNSKEGVSATAWADLLAGAANGKSDIFSALYLNDLEVESMRDIYTPDDSIGGAVKSSASELQGQLLDSSSGKSNVHVRDVLSGAFKSTRNALSGSGISGKDLAWYKAMGIPLPSGISGDIVAGITQYESLTGAYQNGLNGKFIDPSVNKNQDIENRFGKYLQEHGTSSGGSVTIFQTQNESRHYNTSKVSDSE